MKITKKIAKQQQNADSNEEERKGEVEKESEWEEKKKILLRLTYLSSMEVCSMEVLR